MAGRGQIEEIYQEHSGALWAFLLNVLRDEDLAREAIQEVFAKITARPSLLAEARNERAYLLRLAHNQAVDLIRKDAAIDRKKKVVQASSPTPFAPTADPDEQAFREALTRSLAELPPDQRAVVHLKLWEGLTFDAIATALDIPQNTAASRYRYGLDKLRTLLRPLYEEIK